MSAGQDQGGLDVASKKKAVNNKKRFDESTLYTQEEDKGGWGRHNTFLRNMLDSTNPAKSSYTSRSPRFKTARPSVDQVYDTDRGSGHRRSIALSIQENPRRYDAVFNDSSRWDKDKGPATSALYDVSKNPISGSIEHKAKTTPRRYFGQFQSVVERGYDPRDGNQRAAPDYDHGDGPKPSFAAQIKTSPRKYCMMSSKESREVELDTVVQPVEEYDTDVGRNQSMARGIELSAIEYANMRSKVDRFNLSEEENAQDFHAQESKTLGKKMKETPRRYHNVCTKTPRFEEDDNSAGGQDFYGIDTAHKKSISNGLKNHPVRYRSSLGSQTARFESEESGYGAQPEGDADGMSYNTDTGHKMCIRKSVDRSARKYSQFRSKVPRFNSDSMGKKKGKKLDMDAVYEAELKRVTGVREPAEYYIPNYGSHRGVSEQVKRSTRKYASSFQSKTPRFPGASNGD